MHMTTRQCLFCASIANSALHRNVYQPSLCEHVWGVFAQYHFSGSQLGQVPTVCCDRSRSSQTDTATLAFGLLFAVLLFVLLWPELCAQCPGTSRQKLRVFEPGSRWRDQGEKFLSSNEGSIIGGVVAVVCVAAGAIGFM